MSTSVEAPAERLSSRGAWAMLVLLLAAVGLIVGMYMTSDDGATSDEAIAAAAAAEPAHLEQVEGSEISRVRLSADAAKRLAIETTAVRRIGRRLSVPYSAVLYDPTGKTWVYTSPKPLVFMRRPVEIVRIDGGRAFLSSGPRAGTAVARVGVAELYGTEFEVGH